MQTTQHSYGQAMTVTSTPTPGLPVEPVPATIKANPHANRPRKATAPYVDKAAARKRGKAQRASRKANRR